MDYRSVKAVAREAMWRLKLELVSTKDCPVCATKTTMLRVEVWPKEEEKIYIEGTEEYEVKWRCMNCMNLFTEKLEQV